MLILCTLANTKIQHYFEKLLFYGLFQKVGNFSNMILDNRIKEILAEKGKEYKWLAQLLRKPVLLIKKWCENKVKPSFPTLETIANSLNIETIDTNFKYAI